MADNVNLLTLPRNGNGNGKMMKCRRRTMIVFGCLLAVVLCIYFVFFRHAPTDELLAVNSKSSSDELDSIGPAKVRLFNDGKDDLRRKQAEKWQLWAEDRKSVVIGNYYSNCEDDAIMIGKVTMIPDRINGGVLSYHYFNATWENEVEDGTMFIEVKYNGQDLYSNHFDLCTIDEEVIHCPYKAGLNHIEGTIKIPAYIPKGQYTCKAWLKDQDDVVIGCGYADFWF